MSNIFKSNSDTFSKMMNAIPKSERGVVVVALIAISAFGYLMYELIELQKSTINKQNRGIEESDRCEFEVTTEDYKPNQ